MKSFMVLSQGVFGFFSEQSALWHPCRVAIYCGHLLGGRVVAAAGADVDSCIGARYAQRTAMGKQVLSASDVDKLLERGEAQRVAGIHVSDSELRACCVRLCVVLDFVNLVSEEILEHPDSDRSL